MSGLEAFVLDGPAAGTYEVKRAAARMVFTVDRLTGQQFALDEDGDVIEPSEDAYVYESDGTIGWLCGKRATRMVSYEYAGRLDAGTGEFVAATDDEISEIRRAGRERIFAFALGDPPPERTTTAKVNEQQAVLF